MRDVSIFKGLYGGEHGNKIRIAFFSDLHIDSKAAKVGQLVADLNKEAAAGSRILINGDLIDGILPKDLKRYSRGGDRGGSDSALNEIVDTVVSVLAPVAGNIDVIGAGNHEMSIVKHHSFDIIRAVIERLRFQTGAEIRQAGYRGFVKYEYQRESSGDKRALLIFMHHGKGGSAPVTKGMIDLARLYTQFGSADVLWVGHKHTDITDRSSPAIEINKYGKMIERDRVAFITPGYHGGIDCEDDSEAANDIFGDKFYGVNRNGYKTVEWEPYKNMMEVIS